MPENIVPSDREALKAAQARMEAVYQAAKSELLRIPGVVEVGIGLRERGGGLTREPAWRVYVETKKPLAEIPESERVPAMVQGFPTDVIKREPRHPLIGFNDEDDTSNYSRKIAGAQINRKYSSGSGTLGCFVRTADNRVAILTNYHVLWEETDVPSDGIGVGQPLQEESLCCVCNEFATTVTPPAGNGYGNAGKMDCAIAHLKSGVNYSPRIKTIRRPDNTVEQDGAIAGTGAATMGDDVWKVGRTTGLTRGTLSQIAPDIIANPTAAFSRMVNFGDSGSTLIDQSTGNIIGLIWGMSGADNHGIAIPIANVLTNLSVTVIATAAGDGTVGGVFDEVGGPVFGPSPADTIAEIVERLAARPHGAEIAEVLRRHRGEVVTLVNTSKPVIVAWQRNAGPAWMAAVLRSAREPLYRFPEQLNGVPRAQLAARLIDALERTGSDVLRQAIADHAAELCRVWESCDTVDDMIAAWNAPTVALAAE